MAVDSKHLLRDGKAASAAFLFLGGRICSLQIGSTAHSKSGRFVGRDDRPSTRSGHIVSCPSSNSRVSSHYLPATALASVVLFLLCLKHQSQVIETHGLRTVYPALSVFIVFADTGVL